MTSSTALLTEEKEEVDETLAATVLSCLRSDGRARLHSTYKRVTCQ